VLAWKGEGECHTSGLEYLAISMKSIESILELDEIILDESVTSYNITKIQERAERAYHIFRDMSLDCGQIDLNVRYE
jgi:hypothetical protein